jgi:integrase
MATFQTRAGRVRAIVRKPNFTASKTFARLTDAKLWARAKEREADLADVVPNIGKAEGTLGDLIDRYEREIWPLKKWGRSKAHELKTLGTDLGAMPLAGITKQVVVDYAQRLAERTARAGVSTRISYLRTVLVCARDLWGIRAPVAAIDEALTVTRHHRISGRGVPRTRRPVQDEIDAIIAHARTARRSTIDLAEIVGVLSVLPLRVGELCNVEWDDLRPNERAVLIRSRKHPDAEVKAGNDDLVSLPKLGQIDTYDLVAGRPRYFQRPFPYLAHSVSSAWWLAAVTAGVRDLHLHDLRAHAISTMLAAGVSIPVVASISGHRNWKILQRVYERITPEEAHAAIARVHGTRRNINPTSPK